MPDPDDAAAPATDALVALARRLQERCLELGLTVSTAESCTGGLVAHLITEVPGSSTHFQGGVVAYSNGVKEAELGVPADVLRAHGAVSAQVARAMAEGARAALRTHLAVGVTGIAGPDGGTDAKPVGLTYIAVVGAGNADVRRYLWTGDRRANKLWSADAALRMLLDAADRGPA